MHGALPLMEPLDHLASGVMVSALLQVPVAGFRVERPVGVGDPVPLPAGARREDLVPTCEGI